MAKVPNAVEILPEIWTAWLKRTNVTDDRQTGGWAIAYSKRECEFTFAKNGMQPPLDEHWTVEQSAAIACEQKFNLYHNQKKRIGTAGCSYGHCSSCYCFPSSRHHLSNDDCLEDKREDYQNCSVLCCVRQLCTMIRTHIWPVLKDECLGLDLAFCVFFQFILDYFVLVSFALVVLGLVSSLLRQDIGWEERLRNDLLCV